MAPTISLRVRVLTTMTLVLLLVSGLDLTGLERPVRSADNAAAPPSAYPLPHPLLLSPGTTTRVSVASDSTQGNDTSRFPSISADGRTVAFDSWASSLVSDDTNGAADVFVHDRQTGQTTRVSVASDGTQGNNWSLCPSISADGRYVAFSSDANNLVSGDTNDTSDVFVHDRQTGQTTRISVASDGTQGNNSSNQYYSLSISADGRYVAFDSRADNLVSGDTNDTSDVFVHDRQMGQTTRVSVASDGAQGHGESVYSAISTDGRCVAFESCASNLVSGDTNDRWDVFVHDRGITTTWTLMFYFDGDNNLDGTYPPIFNQLEAAANNPNVQVVAVWDRLGPNNSAYYKVQYDSDLNRLAPYTAT